jgi:hypothetical protein
MSFVSKGVSSRHVYLIIIIGISSMLVAIFLLFSSVHNLYTQQNKETDAVDIKYKNIGAKDTAFAILDSSASTISVPKEQTLFNNNPELFIWICAVALMVAFATSMAPILLLSIKDIRNNFKNKSIVNWKLLIMTISLLILIASLSSYNKFLITPIEVIEKFHILVSSPAIIRGIVLYTLAIGMIAVYGQLLINKSLNELPVTIQQLSPDEIKTVSLKFSLLRQKLKFFLISCASLIVFAIITTQLVRSAILKEIKTDLDIVPISFVYVYGAVFTFFLAVLYLPLYYRLKQKGVAMLNVPEDEATEKQADLILRRFIIKETPVESFKITFSILAPILTTLIPNIKFF